MVSQKYKVLIIGCGNQGVLADAKGSGNEHKVISFAHALKEREDIFDVYYHDSNFMKPKLAEYLWGGKSVTTFLSISLMIPENYDIIIITTPDDTHFATLIEILECHNPKLVICEKPLCSTVDEARKIVSFYRQEKIPILVNYTRRFIPKIRDLFKHGRVVEAYGMFNRGLLHTGTHLFDLMNMFNVPKSNSFIKEVTHEEYRVWDISMRFEDGYTFSERRIKDMPVPSYYDFHTRYVMQNAINYLEGKEELFCDMYDGLKALEDMEVFKK